MQVNPNRFLFRVWSVQDAEYIGCLLDHNGSMSVVDKRGQSHSFPNADQAASHGFFLEQATGYLDSNGLLIYEQDIITVDWSTDTWDERDHLLVRWGEGVFLLRDLTNQVFSFEDLPSARGKLLRTKNTGSIRQRGDLHYYWRGNER